jgi:hypothetical protein
MLTSRGTLRHPKFSELIEAISVQRPEIAQIIEGAIWEIERNPKGLGVHIEQIDVWQARLSVPSSPDLLLYYSVAPRFVTMLTIKTADGSNLP